VASVARPGAALGKTVSKGTRTGGGPAVPKRRSAASTSGKLAHPAKMALAKSKTVSRTIIPLARLWPKA
jgi:hypothetical protein